MTTLWDTTGSEVVKALATERRESGAVAFGLALTLVVVVDEKNVRAAEETAKIAASAHPCRLLVVVRRGVESESRLDAEVSIGGRLGPGESVVMRMYGRLTLHAESVTLPLLAPDAPVVTWWYGTPPDKIAYDPLGVFADRRVTDASAATDPPAVLRQRAVDFVPGDTDLCWSRTTPWRTLLAAAWDSVYDTPRSAVVTAARDDPSAALLGGWLASRLSIPVTHEQSRGAGISGVTIRLDDDEVRLTRQDSRGALLHKPGTPDRVLQLVDPGQGDQLAEELRRLDADPVYSDALSAWSGIAGLSGRSWLREHIWRDPAQQSAAGEAHAPAKVGA